MNDIDAIREIEAIKQLKARYCRFLDAKDWAAWRSLFTDGFVSDTIESGGRLITGADEFVAFVRKMLGAPGRTTVHHIHAPEIVLDSPTAAHGIWAMEDIVRFVPGLNLRGYGHYDETYEKIGAAWQIKSSKLTRLRMDLVTPFFSVKLPARRRQ
ncbi:MAG: nuclear transport factor 2 family protein [Pseudomonadota bacterium]|nr:nuclear transport factor 2 family protein [Pseudomonadota bacterium]